MPFSSAAMSLIPCGCLADATCGRLPVKRALSCKSLKFKIIKHKGWFSEALMSGLSRSSHALVTGGGRGIGRAVAEALSQAGATVPVLGRNRAVLDEAVASGTAHFAAIADVADRAAVASAIAE